LGLLGAARMSLHENLVLRLPYSLEDRMKKKLKEPEPEMEGIGLEAVEPDHEYAVGEYQGRVATC
jgi:hypothetical protein